MFLQISQGKHSEDFGPQKVNINLQSSNCLSASGKSEEDVAAKYVSELFVHDAEIHQWS